jgi:signal transduction histidine kinase/sensor domain CHASE-containing protein
MRPGPNLLLALLYALAGGGSYLLMRGTGFAMPVLPAAGIAFAFLFQRGPALFPGLVTGAFLLNLAVQAGAGSRPPKLLLVSLLIALAVGLAAHTGAVLVRRSLGPRPPLARSDEILTFMLLAGPIACLVSSAPGVLILGWAGLLPVDSLADAWLIWWVGESIGVIVFGPLVLMAFPALDEIWQGRRLGVAIPSLLVLGISLAAFLHGAWLERSQNALRLHARADAALEALRGNLAGHREALHSIQALVEADPDLTPAAFERYASRSLARMRGLHALSWNPLLSGEEIPAFERRQRQLGLEGFRVHGAAPAAGSLPALPGAQHVPVAYIEPLAANRAALGFDIHSEPVRARALARSLSIDAPQVTAPVRLVQESGSQKGVLTVIPVHRDGRVAGFAVAVYRLGDLLTDTFRATGWQRFQLRLVDRTPGEPPRDLARVPESQPDPRPEPGLVLRSDPPVLRRLEEGGRTWELELRPNPAYGRSSGVATAPALLLGGLLSSGLLEGFLLLMTGIERQGKRELEQKLRTSLVAAGVAHEIKQPLAILLLQARAMQAAVRGGREEVDPGLLREAAESVAREARQLSRTVDRIRDILGNVVSTLRPIDPAEPIRAALVLARTDLTRQGITVRCAGLDLPRRIQGDGEQLQLAILNLIRNAIEAAGPGGTLEIRLTEDDDGVEVAVGDDGPGFDPAIVDLERLLLSSGKPGGSGIGLYLVRCTMDNHGGVIRIGRSALGGAEVRLRFPAAPAAFAQRRR